MGKTIYLSTQQTQVVFLSRVVHSGGVLCAGGAPRVVSFFWGHSDGVLKYVRSFLASDHRSETHKLSCSCHLLQNPDTFTLLVLSLLPGILYCLGFSHRKKHKVNNKHSNNAWSLTHRHTNTQINTYKHTH